MWRGQWGQLGVLLARHALGHDTDVEDRFIGVMEPSSETLGETFDVVLFLGVLYHLSDPINDFERVASICRGILVIETETGLNWLSHPAARLWAGVELKGDDTNWSSMNRAALVALLRRYGFTDIRVVYKTSMLRRLGRAIKSGRGLRNGFRANAS